MKFSVLFLIFFFLISCQSKINEVVENNSSHIFHKPLVIKKKKSLSFVNNKSKIKSIKPSSAQKKQCHYLTTSLQPGLTSLLRFRKKELKQNNPYLALSSLSHEECLSLPQKSLVKFLSKLKDIQNKKIALVLPLTGEKKDTGEFLLKGFKAYASYRNIDLPSQLKVFDSESSVTRAKSLYADLVIENDFSVIVGGAQRGELGFMNQISERFRIPMFAFNHAHASLDNESNPYFFELSPGDYYQGKALARMCQQKGFQQVALLKPRDGHADPLVDALIFELEKVGISVETLVSYDSGSYESMNEAVQNLYQEENPDEALEEDDFKEISGIKDPNFVEPPPEVKFQALFIPDNFRILKHFIKLFHFHDLSKFVLFGNGQWRSEGLTQHWERFLEDSFFVDSLGKIQNVPTALAEVDGLKTVEGIIRADLSMVGYYGAKVVFSAVRTKESRYRHQIAKRIYSMSRESLFEKPGAPYRSAKGFHWPSYIFSLENRELRLKSRL